MFSLETVVTNPRLGQAEAKLDPPQSKLSPGCRRSPLEGVAGSRRGFRFIPSCPEGALWEGGGGRFRDFIGPAAQAPAAGAGWERALGGQPGIAGEILAKSFLNSLGCNFGEILTLVGSCADC